jgi:hypothetical protein
MRSRLLVVTVVGLLCALAVPVAQAKVRHIVFQGKVACVLNPSTLAAAEATLRPGTAATELCKHRVFVAHGTASRSVTARVAADDCGEGDFDAEANNPSKGWIHEHLFYQDLTAFVTYASFIGYWHNNTTGGGNNYTFAWSGLSYNINLYHNAYTKGGYVYLHAIGSAVVQPVGSPVVCDYATPPGEVHVS